MRCALGYFFVVLVACPLPVVRRALGREYVVRRALSLGSGLDLKNAFQTPGESFFRRVFSFVFHYNDYILVSRRFIKQSNNQAFSGPPIPDYKGMATKFVPDLIHNQTGTANQAINIKT